MQLDGRIKTELRQTRRLGQSVQQALRLVCLGPTDVLTTLMTEAEANPFLRVQHPQRPARTTAALSGLSMPEPQAHAPGLIAHVLGQLDGLVARKEDRRLARALIEELDATGYLLESPSRIAHRCGVPIDRLESVLQQMRQAQPAGLFARDLADCLALQLDDQGALTPAFRRLLTRLPMIAAGDIQGLARHCDVTPTRLSKMLAHLRALAPRPGAAFGWQHPPGQIPELLFVRNQSGWDVQLNSESQPRLALDHALWARMQGQLSPDLTAAWIRARQLASALDLRNRSVLAVGRCVVSRQSAALSGNTADQLPLTRRMVAIELGLHETTVGRIVKHASARVEGKTVALSQFFGRQAGKATSPTGVSRQRLLSLISDCLDQHKNHRRMTDASIAAWLADQHIIVARRTVAKYRQQLQHCLTLSPDGNVSPA